MVEASNAWAACARENGFAGLADAQLPEEIESGLYPMVLLPRSITVGQFEALLAACPATAEWGGETAKVEGNQMQPAIGFDAPGYDGVPSTVELPQADRDRFNELITVLADHLVPDDMGGWVDPLAPTADS
jgi:hypothetical protein